MSKKIFYGWIVIGGAMILNGVGTGLCASLLGLFFPSISAKNGFSLVEVSSIMSALLFGALSAAVLMPKLVKKIGARKMVLFGGIIYGMIVVGMGMVNELKFYYTLAFLMGFFALAVTILPISPLITVWFKSRRALAMGITMAGSGMGPALIAPYISKVIKSSGHETAFVHMGFIVISCTLIAGLIIRNKPEDMGLKTYGLNEGDPGERNDDKGNDHSKLYNYSLKEAIKTLPFWTLVGFAALSSTICSSVIMQVPSYLTALKFEGETIGFIVSAYAISLMVGKIINGAFYDKFGLVKGNFLFMACFIMALVSLLRIPQSTGFVYAYVIFSGLAYGVVTVTIPIIISSNFGIKNFSSIFATSVLVTNGVPVVGVALSGAVIQTSGYSTFITICIAAACLALAFVQISVISGKKLQVNASKRMEA